MLPNHAMHHTLLRIQNKISLIKRTFRVVWQYCLKTFYQKEALAQVFSWEFCKISKNTWTPLEDCLYHAFFNQYCVPIGVYQGICIEVIFCLSFTAYPAAIDNNGDRIKETKTLSNYQRVLEILQGNFWNYSVFAFITHFQQHIFYRIPLGNCFWMFLCE